MRGKFITINAYIKKNRRHGVAILVKYEVPELTSSHGHTKIATIYRKIIKENNLKISRKDLHNYNYKIVMTMIQASGLPMC